MTRIPALYRCGVCPTGLYLPSSSCLRWQLVDGGGGGGGRGMRSRGMHKTEMPSIFRYRGVYRGLSLPPFISIARRSIHGHRCADNRGYVSKGIRKWGGSVARYRRSLPGYKLIGLLCNRGSHVTWETRLCK